MKNENRVYFARCKAKVLDGTRCTTVMDSKDMVLVEYKDNDNYYYVCPECGNTVHSYSTKNHIKINKPAKHGYTFGMEHELSRDDLPFINHLKTFGFIATHDGTVAIEMKSGTYQSFAGACKTLTSLDRAMGDDIEEFFEYNVGTHCNIGHRTLINEDTIGYIKRFYFDIFENMSRLLENNPEPTTKVFGRELCYWARPIERGFDIEEHRNFVNVQHNSHLEFRFTKYRDARQYIDSAKICREITDKVVTHFIEYYEYPLEKEYIDLTRYKSQDEFRLKKARTCSNQIVKLIGKAFKNAGYDIDLKPYLNKLY